jgi:hypothetical protein
MQTLLDPAILFFVFGALAGALRSNLEIPSPVARFLSLYLLMALGLKGGFALADAGLDASALRAIGAAVLLAAAVPALGYAVLRRHVPPFDAVAVAASYGSVSAVTFVTTLQFLESQGLHAGGHMTVAMVLMESPAVVMAVLMAGALRHQAVSAAGLVPLAGGVAALRPGGGMAGLPAATSLGHVLREAFTDGAHLLLLGSLAIGVLSGDAGKAAMHPFTGDLFKGMLAFFLLDMGLMVARNFGTARQQSPALIVYALLGPLVHAAAALALALLLRLPAADAALLMVLAASASYIVVPAVLRHAMPEANPSVYFGLSLGITFPLNIVLGVPLYTQAARWALGG